MGDGTKENPFTREDVLRLIEENGGKAEGLDLSRKVFKEGIDLSKLELNGIILKEAKLLPFFDGEEFIGANLDEVDLFNANLEGANLYNASFKGANLYGANLSGANLTSAHLDEADLWNANLNGSSLRWVYFNGADLWNANLKGAHLLGAHLDGVDFGDTHLEGSSLANVEFPRDAKLEGADWGNYILGEEREGLFYPATDIYRHLKTWYTERGIYDIAGEFFFREMEAKRKALKWWPKPWNRAWSNFLSLICGYGEKWYRVIISATVVILGLAVAFYFWGSFSSSSFWDTLYYSAASFTALGYGNWAPQPTGWAKGVGAAEAFIGVFMMALFLITFVRKMTR